MLANKIDDAPATVSLLDVSERQRRNLRPSKTAADQHGKDGAITQSPQCRDIGCADKSLSLS